MGYEQQFVTARKAVEAKIKPLNPSKELIKVIDDDRAKGLATKLDQATGKLYEEMDAAVNAFEAYRVTYFKKIDAQVAREKDPTKLRPLFKPLSKLMESIVQQYEKLCDEKRKVELAEAAKKKALEDAVKAKTQGPPVKAAPGTGPIGGANTPPALKDALIKISNEFRKRGQKQLQVSVAVNTVCMGTRKQVGVLYETLQKELKTATDLSRKGMLQSAGRLKTEGQAQFNKAKTLTTDAAKHFNVSLKPFARPHPLTRRGCRQGPAHQYSQQLSERSGQHH